MPPDHVPVMRRIAAISRLGGLGAWRIAGLAVVFTWFLVGGIAHFALTEVEMRIVPPWMPWPRAAVLASGVFELLGAAGLLWHRSRRAAGVGLFLLTIAVTPAHVYMLQRPDLFDVAPWLLWLRLPVQVALLWLIAWSTASAAPARDAAHDGPAPRAGRRRISRRARRAG